LTPEDTIWTVVLSLVSSGVAGIVVAAIFYLFFKPKSEKVFEYNRKSNLKLIFRQLSFYDNFDFMHIIDTFEKEFGPLGRGRKELFKTIKFVNADEKRNQEPLDFSKYMEDDKTLSKLRKGLEPNLKKLHTYHIDFTKDIPIFSHYLHDSILRDIVHYYLNSNLYVEWLMENHIENSCMDERKNLAENIIKYLKEDRSIDKEEKSIKEFIDKWEKELK